MKTEELPYERFMRYGAECLTDAELIAIILRTGTQGKSAVDVARLILTEREEHAPELSVLYRSSLKTLTDIPGIGEVKAVKLLCIAELSQRLARIRTKGALCFRDPETVYQYYCESLRHERREKLVLILLNERLSLLREITMTVGTQNMTLVPCREILSEALREGASAFLLLHNHPSGDPTPSGADIQSTQELARAAAAVHIRFLDHIVIGDDYCSLAQMGILNPDGEDAESLSPDKLPAAAEREETACACVSSSRNSMR